MPVNRSDGRLAELLRPIRGIAFDKDGTLIDLDARWMPFFVQVIDRVAAHSSDPTLVGRLQTLLGVAEGGLVPDGPASVETLGQIVDRLVDELVRSGHDPSHAVEIVGGIDLDSGHGPLRPLGPVGAALADLSACRYPIAIATSDGRCNTVDELAVLGVAVLVDTMRCGDDDGPVKPDPMVLVSIAIEWGIDPAGLLFVGDSRQDLATARAAGSPFVARCDPDRMPGWVVEADAVIADITELVVG